MKDIYHWADMLLGLFLKYFDLDWQDLVGTVTVAALVVVAILTLD